MTELILTLEPELQNSLEQTALRHGRSPDEEACHILRASLQTGRPDGEINLAEAIRREVAPYGGFEIELPPRMQGRGLPRFEE